jgi:hypothetical protein
MTEMGDGFITYIEILESLDATRPLSPKEICESRRRENIVRIQCRTLVECDLVERVTHELYLLSDRGISFLGGDLELPIEDGDIDVEQIKQSVLWSDSQGGISNLSKMDAETIKQFNFKLYLDTGKEYGLVDYSHEKTKRRIWNVKDFELHRVINEFPIYEPLVQQCGHWVRAICGKHFFPDANHRTAMASLNALLKLNGIQVPQQWPGREIGRTVLKSKFIRNFVVDVRFDNLWKRDELYWLWHRHFRNLFYDTSEVRHHHVSTDYLRKALENARNTK